MLPSIRDRLSHVLSNTSVTSSFAGKRRHPLLPSPGSAASRFCHPTTCHSQIIARTFVATTSYFISATLATMDSFHTQDNDEPPLHGSIPASGSGSGSGSSSAQQAQQHPQDAQPSQSSPTSTYWATEPPGIMPTPTRPDSPGTALKKEKGRVRFNSNAGANPNPFADPPPSHNAQLRPSPISRPKPSIIRKHTMLCRPLRCRN